MIDTSMASVALGSYVRSMRRRRKLGLTPLARAMGCGRQNARHLENGAHRWTIERLVGAADLFKMKPGALLDRALNGATSPDAPAAEVSSPRRS